ncbi:hypothetical protein TWF281_010020 [Arthrobotrys megalospora]
MRRYSNEQLLVLFLLLFTLVFVETSTALFEGGPSTTLTSSFRRTSGYNATTTVTTRNLNPATVSSSWINSTITLGTKVTQTPPSNTVQPKILQIDTHKEGSIEPKNGSSKAPVPEDNGKISEGEIGDLVKSRAPPTPGSFYIAIVRCPNIPDILAMDENPANYKTFLPSGDGSRTHTRPMFNMMSTSPKEARRRADYWKKTCEDCVCDPEKDELVGRGPQDLSDFAREAFQRKDHNRGNGKIQHTICYGSVPEKCMDWLDCRCEYQMRYPSQDDGIPLSDYQAALDGLPEGVKLSNPKFKWQPQGPGGVELGWTGGATGAVDTADILNEFFEYPNNRELVPGTKEPYYLEGPSSGPPRNRLASPYLLGGSGYGGSAYVKRQESDQLEPVTGTLPRTEGMHESDPLAK